MPRLELAFDIAAQTPEAHGGRSAVLSAASAAYMLGRDLQIDFAFGARSAGSTAARRLLAAGFSVRF